jgi:hypothetical protein
MIPRELWIANLVEAAAHIANRDLQELRWLSPDAYAWERPEELINVLFGDCAFERFIDEFASTFSEDQCRTAFALRDGLNRYCDDTPTHLNPAEVLGDPRWEAIRQNAATFVLAFEGKWPTDTSRGR